MSKTSSHILNAASNLLGISIVMITGLKVTGHGGRTMADEVAWVAALSFALSCLLSYLDLRAPEDATSHEKWADRLFLIGLAALIGSALVLALSDVSSQSVAIIQAMTPPTG
jgi:hypothetical protein